MLEIYVKSRSELICVDDIQVSGSDCDAFVEDCSAWFKGTDIDIADQDLLQEIMEYIDDECCDLVQEIAFENDICAAEHAYDSAMDR